MTTFQVPGFTLDADTQSSTTPLVVLFERDDAIAVPLLSQLRIAGYDVRAARTPVELFDVTGKQRVALVLIDLGSATAGRREFWVALDTQRRGRSIQVMTFRYSTSASFYDSDIEPAARAMADVEVHGTHEFQLIIEGVRQRVPLHDIHVAVNPLAAPPGLDPLVAANLRPALQPGVIAPIGAALGVPSPFMSQPSEASSPFAHPATSNPFSLTGELTGPTSTLSHESPFAKPYSSNPFSAGADESDSESLPTAALPTHAFSYQVANDPTLGSFEERAAQLSNAYAAEFGIGDGHTVTSLRSSGVKDVRESNGRLSPEQTWDAAEFFDTSSPNVGAASPSPRMPADQYSFSDAWTPPGTGANDSAWDMSALPSSAPSTGSHASTGSRISSSNDQDTAFTPTEYAPALAMKMPFSGSGDRKVISPEPEQTLAPVPPPQGLPRARPASLTEESLGSVLVEGALLSEQKLEALQGVQQMLSNVHMDFKLGELAMLFKFLSADQLLAALLVSRGLVTPQQIANLGRTKQDLANSGMDYNLADLLIMFNVLPEEQVRQMRNEIAS